MRELFFLALLLCALLGVTALPARAFNPPVAVEGPLKVEILGLTDVSKLNTKMLAVVRVSNSGDVPLSGTVRVQVIDRWSVDGPTEQPFEVGPGAKQDIEFALVAGDGTHAALYPVHAFATFGSPERAAHAVAVVRVESQAIPPREADRDIPLLRPAAGTRTALERLTLARMSIAQDGAPERLVAIGGGATEEDTGAFFGSRAVLRPDARPSLTFHPPWRKGPGSVMLDYRVAFPAGESACLETSTAIRDSFPHEPLSDGVEFRVLVSDGGGFKEVFRRFSDSKTWEDARVDLSAFAGKTVTLRLWAGPGPANDTTCDEGYFAAPTLVVGHPAPDHRAERFEAAKADAVRLAREGLAGRQGSGHWQIRGETETSGAAVVPGDLGILDAAIGLASETGTLAINGLYVEVDGEPLGGLRSGAQVISSARRTEGGTERFDYSVALADGRQVPVRIEVFPEKGALRSRFSMPGAVRDKRGSPRFTAIRIGDCDRKALRVYAGFGNVVADPEPFDLTAGGFTLSTRHVGADYEGGLSVVQATDIFPDLFRVQPADRLYALQTHHDATISLIPSAGGAFAAARQYAVGIAGFRPAPGVDGLKGRMCLDNWAPGYVSDEEGIRRAAEYGLTDALFVKHVWQRWGYDYRLPDIYPPRGSLEEFLALANACRATGISLVPHDNYIDFYPDADGYSYRHILFNEDGTPQLAWFNPGPKAQSYRWNPLQFRPFLLRNRDLLAKNVRPGGIFVDVFSAIPPLDFYNEAGEFFPKTVSAEKWGECFDTFREGFGPDSITVSEAGTDALIGHLDAGESDHGAAFAQSFGWNVRGADAERVPWHDMGTHGAFILLAGGLGPRYAGDLDSRHHGYGSDDYLSTTVLGGRNPMCDGPFNRNAVMTYWLLHDACAELARQPMLRHEFADGDIHRQKVTFGGECRVVSNRGESEWTVDGHVLPQYGFIVHTPRGQADVSMRQGVISACARFGDTLFVDARSQMRVRSDGPVSASVDSLEDLGGRRFRLNLSFEVHRPLPEGQQPFLHFDRSGPKIEQIAFQADGLVRGDWRTRGRFRTSVETKVPAEAAAGKYPVRLGFWNPATGERMAPRGVLDANNRLMLGVLHVGDDPTGWQPDAPPEEPRANKARKMLDFGEVQTNGAFRLARRGNVRTLTPLPGNEPFDVSIVLGQGKRAAEVSIADIDGQPGTPLKLTHSDGRLSFTVPADTRQCRVQMQ